MQKYEKKSIFANPMKIVRDNKELISPPYAELLDKARRYCAAEEHCRSDVSRKLRDWGATAEQNETAMEQLCEENYIDERRYAERYCTGKLRIQHWGRIKIAWGLRSKGLQQSDIEHGLAAIDEDEYRSVMNKTAESKMRAMGGSKDWAAMQKLKAYLMSHGFEGDEIATLLDS